MGKKNKDQDPTANLNSVANRDIIQRINFLHQASTYLSSISQTLPPTAADAASKPQAVKRKGQRQKGRRPVMRHPGNVAELSRSYVGTMRIVGQKTMVRMDPSLKRTLCKGCDNVLFPGSTASVRVHPLPSHGEAVYYTCLNCNTTRRIPAPPYLDVDKPMPDNAASSADADPIVAASASVETPDSKSQSATGMDLDSNNSSSTSQGRRARKKAVPRVPPLFERKGHVVFRGDEKLTEVDPPA